MNREDQLERLRKVLELAKRGVDGEKETAQALLERLMAKWGISLDELGGEMEEGSRERRLRFEDLDDYYLWWYIVTFVREVEEASFSCEWGEGKSGWVLVELSQFEFAQVMSLHEVLYDALVLSQDKMDGRHKTDRDEYTKVIKWHQSRIKELQEERKQLYPQQREERKWLIYTFVTKNKLNVYKKTSETASSSSGNREESEGKRKVKSLSEREWEAYLAAMGDSEIADTTKRFGAQCLPGGES